MNFEFSDCLKENFSILNRKEYVKNIIDILNSADYKIINITGSAGVGKTYLLKSIFHLLKKNLQTYYYECSEATNLDDIILSLFNHLKKITAKDREYIKTFRISPSFSIDERLINKIKNLEKPFLILLDGTENIFRSTDEKTKKELLSFLNFISSSQNIKIIIAGESFSEFEHKKGIYTLKLEGLNRENAFELIKNIGIPCSKELMQELFKLTNGYPESILLFLTFVKNSNINAEAVLDKIKNSEINLESFLIQQLYLLIPKEYKELISFFALIRHLVSMQTLKKLDLTPDIEKKVLYLTSLMVLNKNNNNFHLKQGFKKHIQAQISREERIKIHKKLHELYSEQIIAKLENRILPVSRKLLRSEQYYHYNKLVKSGVTENFQAKKQDSVYDKSSLESDGFALNFSDYYEDIQAELSEYEKNLLDYEANNSDIQGLYELEHFNDINPVVNKPKAEIKNLINNTEKELQEKLIAYEQQEDKQNYYYTLFKLASFYKDHFRHELALKNYYTVLNCEVLSISTDISFEALKNIGEIYDYRRDHNMSLNYYTKALKEAQNIEQKAEIYFKLALAYDDAGDFEKALNFYHENINISENLEENAFLAASYSNTADIYEEKGIIEKAIEFYKKSLNIDTQTNNPEGLYDVFLKLGNIYLGAENYSEAGKYFYRELSMAKKLDDPYKIAMSYLDMGDIFLIEKNYEKALKSFILAQKSIDKTISTDSREKINRRFRQVAQEVGQENYTKIIEKIKNNKTNEESP
ncbi:MAG TPA: tetratricopeptide repeat protein [Candidatus Gastranaerophilales bacterium]|nr:tetratricopeptide repeat protein [Candidatus Gastranaerophilales bacterium]